MGEFAIIVSFIIYLVFFGWLGWRRGSRREITVFLIALVAWLLLQQEGEAVVNVANLGGAAVTFAQTGGFTGDQDAAFAAISSAPALVNNDARVSFLYVVWIAIFVAAYALSNVWVTDKQSPSNGWAILFGLLNGLFFAVAFGPSLVALLSPEGEFTVVDDNGLQIGELISSGWDMIWDGITNLWALITAGGNLALVVILTLFLILAASTIRTGAKAKT